jgi:hypothetical protein
MARSARGFSRIARRGTRLLPLFSLLILTLLCLAPALAGAHSRRSVGTPEQIAWVRRAAGNFVTAELAGNGADACGILAAPLRADSKGRTCSERWDAKLTRMLRRPGERRTLRSLLHDIDSARVVVHGNWATIDLPEPLLDSANRLRWTENCWMLSR